MDDKEKLQRAKVYIDKLAKGIDPVTDSKMTVDTFHSDEIIACFDYLSNALENIINSSNVDAPTKKKRGKKAVYITDEQLLSLKPAGGKLKVSEIAKTINSVIAENDTRKLQPAWINDWLESIGFLCKSEIGNRIANAKGNELGITSELRHRENGTDYYINYYSPEAQEFIYSNINAVLDYRYSSAEIISEKYKNLDYPRGMDIKTFLESYPDKCFIISTGWSDRYGNDGYISALIFKGKTKVLRKNNLMLYSSKNCILKGIIDAAKELRSSADIIILTFASLGFNSPKSVNYYMCCEAVDTLIYKGCSVAICVYKGRRKELKDFIYSL